MRKSKAVACSAILGVFFLVTAVAGDHLRTGSPPQTAADVYQAALMKAEAEGDLNGAIKLFESLIAKFPEARELAAKAQLQIGACYEKLGLKQAREAYEKVIEEYPDQGEAVKAAREKLDLLARAASGKEVQEFRMRRVFDGGGLEWGNALSSDNRYLVYTDWETGDMAVVDIRTGDRRRLTAKNEPFTKSPEMGETSAFSPDDKRVAYGWRNRDKVMELRVIDFDGSNMRVLYGSEESAWIRPHAWTPDGKHVLVTNMLKSKRSQIALVSAADGAVHILREVHAQDPGMSLSPDGRYVAYSMPSDAQTSKRDIFLMKIDGGADGPLLAHDADDYLLGWSPDGERLIFASDRQGSYGIWGITVSDGKAQGQPWLIKAGSNKVEPVRLTRDGTLYYGLSESVMDVLVATIDPVTGRIQGQPAPIPTRYSGANSMPDWSPDGRRLAYRTNVGGMAGELVPPLISILDIATGEERQISARIDAIRANDGPHWAPDGRSVLVLGKLGEDNGIFQVDLETGATKTLAIIPRYKFTLYAAWSRDGGSLFYPQGNPTQILKHDLDTGRITELAAMTGPAGIPVVAVSPDGKQLAFTARDEDETAIRLNVVPTSGGDVRELFRAGPNEFVRDLLWTPDGRFLWFRKLARSNDPNVPPRWESWRVSPDGNGLEKLELSVSGGGIRLHPDGRQIAFMTGRNRYDLWALENFLPARKK